MGKNDQPSCRFLTTIEREGLALSLCLWNMEYERRLRIGIVVGIKIMDLSSVRVMIVRIVDTVFLLVLIRLVTC